MYLNKKQVKALELAMTALEIGYSCACEDDVIAKQNADAYDTISDMVNKQRKRGKS